MTGRGTVVLVLVLAALAGTLWLEVGKPRSAPRQAEPLLEAPPAEVRHVELEDDTGRLSARRDDARWVDPAGRAWESRAVTDLLDTLAALRPVMVVDPRPEDAGAYGFGPHARRLRLAAADGRPLLALEVGERNPAWTGLYARRSGRPEVVLVGAVLQWEIEKLREAAPAAQNLTTNVETREPGQLQGRTR